MALANNMLLFSCIYLILLFIIEAAKVAKVFHRKEVCQSEGLSCVNRSAFFLKSVVIVHRALVVANE